MLWAGTDLALLLSDPSFALRMVCVITGYTESRSLSVFKSERVWLVFCSFPFFFFFFFNFSLCLDVSHVFVWRAGTNKEKESLWRKCWLSTHVFIT